MLTDVDMPIVPDVRVLRPGPARDGVVVSVMQVILVAWVVLAIPPEMVYHFDTLCFLVKFCANRACNGPLSSGDC